MRGLGKPRKSYSRINVVPEDGLGSGDIATEHTCDAFAQKFFAEFGIALACLTVVPKYGNIAQGGDPR